MSSSSISKMFDMFKINFSSSDFYKKYKTQEPPLSKGTFGSVYKGYRLSDKKPFAIKIQANNSVSKLEVQILKKLGSHHFHIVSAVDFFKMEKKQFIVLEFCEGNLWDLLETIEVLDFTVKMAAEYVNQILLGVEYIHSCNIGHFDLKLENILTKRDGSKGSDAGDSLKIEILKIADFGISVDFDKHKGSIFPDGTLDYQAPEVIQAQEGKTKKITKKADIWSIGVITYILLSGLSPWSGEKYEEYDSDEETDSEGGEISDQMTISTLDPDKLSDKEEIKMQKIMESDYSFDFPEFNFVGGEALAYIQDFIEATLHLDTKNRPSCSKLLDFDFIKLKDEVEIDSDSDVVSDVFAQSSPLNVDRIFPRNLSTVLEALDSQSGENVPVDSLPTPPTIGKKFDYLNRPYRQSASSNSQSRSASSRRLSSSLSENSKKLRRSIRRKVGNACVKQLAMKFQLPN